MKLKPLLIPFCCLSLAVSASADTFVLKDGSRLEGRILSETSDTYRLEVLIGKSIRDEKTIPKAEVAEIIAVKPDEKEFEKIKGLVPVPDYANADEYARRISAVSKFVQSYSNGSKAAEAEAMLATLKSEAEVVSNGGIKIDGKMVPGTEYQADLYDIDAKILEKRIREAAARGDTVGALRGIRRMDIDFKSTNSRAAVLPFKQQLLRSYKEEIDELISTYDKRVAERDANLARMSRETRVATELALKEETDLVAARLRADFDKDQVWFFTHPFVLDTLQKNRDAIAEQSVPDDFKQAVDSGRVYRNVLKFIAANDEAEKIRDVLDQAEQALIPKRYMTILEAAAAAKGVGTE